MFTVTKFSMGHVTKSNPEYKVIHSKTKRVMGFGSLDECSVMCTALNNRYYPKVVFNNGMKDLLRNED